MPPLLLLATLSALTNEVGIGRRILGTLVTCLAPLLVAGFWYVRDYRLTMLPLYPLHLQLFGRVWLSGWYGPGVMEKSHYYIPIFDWR